jgi:type IV pilus assembly protein PilB
MVKFRDEWLVEPLLKARFIRQEDIEEIRKSTSKETGAVYLSEKIVTSGYVQQLDLARLLQHLFQIRFVNLDQIKINKSVIELIPEEICRKYHVFPYQLNDEYITIAIFDPMNLDAEREVGFMAARLVKTTLSTKKQIEEKINEYYNPDRYINDLSDKLNLNQLTSDIEVADEETEKIDSSKSDAPIVRLINSLLNDAIDKEVSDIHIEPTEKKMIVRFRIDGILKEVLDIPKYAAPQLISRIKVISSLDIAETRKPQDGQAKVKRRAGTIDLRVSILPTSYGEKAVIRILDSAKGSIPFEKLGITGDNLKKLHDVLDLRQGMILATGPTGCGKTTTLYATLNRIKSPTTNILTIEDPIEYTIEGINQVQVNEKAGISFASALRSILRQDPDVILVGEIRDRETAEISIQAALTGHLVLSTVHTNNAMETVTRLIDLGIDRYKISSALSAIIAQRLVRNICKSCCVENEPNMAEQAIIPLIEGYQLPQKFYKGRGCADCDFTGYKGRSGVYEILIIDKEIRDKIDLGAPLNEIERIAQNNGFMSFTQTALILITSGITDLSEVTRYITIKPVQERATSKPDEKVYSPDKAEPPRELAINNSKRKILVAEDDPITRRLIVTMLNKEQSYDIIEAENGIAALSAVEEHKPDMILLDILMPHMDGYEVCEKIRKNKKHSKIPIIMLTALTQKEDLLKGFDDLQIKVQNIPINFL